MSTTNINLEVSKWMYSLVSVGGCIGGFNFNDGGFIITFLTVNSNASNNHDGAKFSHTSYLKET